MPRYEVRMARSCQFVSVSHIFGRQKWYVATSPLCHHECSAWSILSWYAKRFKGQKDVSSCTQFKGALGRRSRAHLPFSGPATHDPAKHVPLARYRSTALAFDRFAPRCIHTLVLQSKGLKLAILLLVVKGRTAPKSSTSTNFTESSE
jgi:hypothetical protein